jgi:hypothetical protein
MVAFLALVLGACADDSAGGPTGPAVPATPIESDRAAVLRAHVEDPFFREWLPGHLQNRDDARPIHALVHRISEDLASLDAALLRESLLAVSPALETYRQRSNGGVEDRVVLRGIELCVQEMLHILDHDADATDQLSQDRG